MQTKIKMIKNSVFDVQNGADSEVAYMLYIRMSISYALFIMFNLLK